MEKYGFIYLWRDKKHNRYYIGSHWGTEDDGYICSSRQMRKAYKRRPSDFKRRTLEIVEDRSVLYDVETKWLQLAEKNKDKHYNRNYNANHWTAYPENVKTIPQKISHSTKEAMQRDDIRQNYLEALKVRDTKSSHEDVRIKRSESMKATLASKDKWPLNAPPDNTGNVRLWKDGKYKMVKENTAKWDQLRDEGWQTKTEYLLSLVDKFRHEVDDHASDLQSVAKRMISIGYITQKEYYNHLKQ